MARLPDRGAHLRAALDYAALGLQVLPLHHPVPVAPAPGGAPRVGCSCGEAACGQVGGHPLAPGGALDASCDPGRVRWWWRRFPLANIGLATGVHFDVFEVQGAGGDLARWASVSAALRAGGPLVRAGGDGWHFYLAPLGLGDRHPTGLERTAWRGLGGFVPAPPSRHPGGAVATWIRGPGPPPAVPAPLRARLLASFPSRPFPSAAVDPPGGDMGRWPDVTPNRPRRPAIRD
jgi:hypothetical protein